MTRPLRVLHLIKGLGRGGAERLLVDGLRHADRERFEYAYGYFLPAKDQLAPELLALGARVVRFDARTSGGVLLRTGAVRRFLEDWGADMVHCHLPVSGVAGRLAAGRVHGGHGIPVVYTEHNLAERYHPLTRWANRVTWRRQARVVAVSEEVAASIRRLTGDRVPVEVVVNGVDHRRFRPDPELRRRTRDELGIPEGAPVIGQVAVFRPQKRLDRWLEAAARVRKGRPDARFVLVGDGPGRREVERRAERLGLREALILPGLQEDVRPYYAALDLYLVSSDYEGLPVALLEAMASGLAVISTAVGGVPEVVRPGHDGLLVPAGEPDALAAAVLRLLTEPGEGKRLGASARERVAESFSTERMTRRLEAIYDEVAGERR